MIVVRYYADYSKWLAGIALVLLGAAGIAFADVDNGWVRYVFLATLVMFLGSVLASAVALFYPPAVEIAQVKFPDDFKENKLPFDPAGEILKRFIRAFGFQVVLFLLGLLGFVIVVFGQVLAEPAAGETSSMCMPQEAGEENPGSLTGAS